MYTPELLATPALLLTLAVQQWGAVVFCDVAILPFTHIALSLGLIGYLFGNALWWSIAACQFWGILCAFHVVLAWDHQAFSRMRAKHGWPSGFFHLGNVFLHAVPCACTLTCPLPMEPSGGVCAAALHLAWGLWASGGTLRMDEVYVPLRGAAWAWAWGVGVVVEVLACEGLAFLSGGPQDSVDR